MLINREIWRKVLLWNSPVLFCLALQIFTGTVSVTAEEVIILKRGPIETYGIDPLPKNAHPAFYGEYIYNEGLVEAYVTYTDIYRQESWNLSKCSGYDIYILPSAETKPAFMYQDPGGWTLIIRFSFDGEYCIFLKELIRKLIYFQGISRNGGTFSFPAIIELPE